MALQRTYDIGDVAELTGTFTDPDTGALVDPAVVTCTVRHPDTTTSSPTVTRTSTGVYVAEQDIDDDGTWWYAFDGEGIAQASAEKRFEVRKRRVPR